MKKNFNDLYSSNLTALTQSFQEACADKDFKKFVYDLNVKEELLEKYTSNLQDAFIEYCNCKNCNGISSCKNIEKGYKYTPIPRERTIDFSYDACKIMNKIIKDNKYKDNLNVFDLNEEIKNASFKDVFKDDKARVPIIKYFKDFIDEYNNNKHPKGLYLHGSFGSGKTYLIASLFNELAKKNIKSTLVYFPDFLVTLKSSFQTDYAEKFNYIKKTPLLLIDDIGAENCSNWSRDEVLGPILQYRMENNLPTFFTSNLTIDELEKSFSITQTGVDKIKAGRIIERIKYLTIQKELISKDRRIK